ncbi:MAG: cation:proton antiporter regulatory subunit [Nitriliruptorales bacterium]|nr:cation:proton antiporter regulatory subunit [Nitriliruptorales bacterium]
MASEVEETPLPGVGVRYSFVASSGARVSVLHHHSGRHQVFVGEPDDPDSARLAVELDDDDSRVLAELLGASRVVREIDRLQQSVAGLAIEWMRVRGGDPAAGRTIGELGVRSSTGVTVVAAMRSGEALPVPGPDFAIEPGDTLVVMGRPDAIRRANELLRG